MDTAGHTGLTWLPYVCCLTLGLTSSAAVTYLNRRRALPADRAPDLPPPRATAHPRSEPR